MFQKVYLEFGFIITGWESERERGSERPENASEDTLSEFLAMRNVSK